MTKDLYTALFHATSLLYNVSAVCWIASGWKGSGNGTGSGSFLHILGRHLKAYRRWVFLLTHNNTYIACAEEEFQVEHFVAEG